MPASSSAQPTTPAPAQPVPSVQPTFIEPVSSVQPAPAPTPSTPVPLPTRLLECLLPPEPALHAHSSTLHSPTLFVLRLLASLYMTSILIYDATILKSPLSKFTYLTNVGYLLTWLYFTTITQSRLIPLAHSLAYYSQLLFAIVFNIQWLITAIYWIILRPSKYTPIDFYLSFNAHGITLILLCIDFVMNNYRFLMKQYIGFVFTLGMYLLVFNLPYSLKVKPVYGRAMDWVSWETYVVILGGLAISLGIHGLGRVLFVKLKEPRLRRGLTEGDLSAQPMGSSNGQKQQRERDQGSVGEEIKGQDGILLTSKMIGRADTMDTLKVSVEVPARQTTKPSILPQ